MAENYIYIFLVYIYIFFFYHSSFLSYSAFAGPFPIILASVRDLAMHICMMLSPVESPWCSIYTRHLNRWFLNKHNRDMAINIGAYCELLRIQLSKWRYYFNFIDSVILQTRTSVRTSTKRNVPFWRNPWKTFCCPFYWRDKGKNWPCHTVCLLSFPQSYRLLTQKLQPIRKGLPC